MNKNYLLLLIFFQFSCIMEIEESHEKIFEIKDFYFDYDQLENKLFLQVETKTENDIVNNVWVQIKGDDPYIEENFILNDSQDSGDLISDNGIYSGIFNIQLEFQNYQLKAFVENLEGDELFITSDFKVESQHYPELLEVLFYKTYENGCEFELGNDRTYFINDVDSSYLNFRIKVKDYNGLENIQSIRYKTTTNWLYADSTGGEGCGCLSNQECINAPPSFFMSPIFSNDSTVTFEAINGIIKDPGFKINPMSVCNRSGLITFSFTIIDTYYGPITFSNIDLFFSNCNEGSWTSDLDCEHCPSVCEECGK